MKTTTKTKTKFKQTELGIIPKDWAVVRIEDVLSRIIDYRGKTPRKSSSGIRTLSAKSIKHGRIDYGQTYFISKETFREWERRGKPQVGDILLTTEGPLGEIAQLDRQDVAIAQRLLTLRGKDKQLDNSFLKYFLMSPMGQHELLSKATGTTVQGIKQSEFRKVLIAKPLFEEQTSIAKILSDLDSGIALKQQMNKTLEEIGKAIFEHWFIDFEFPNEEGKSYTSNNGMMVGSDLGSIPKGWEFCSLGSTLSLFKDGSHYPPKRVNEGIRFIAGASDVKHFVIDFTNCTYITKHDYDQIHRRWSILVNDVLLTIVGTIGNVAIVRVSDLPFSLQRSIAVLRANDRISYIYLYFLLNSRFFRTEVNKRLNPTAQPGIYLAELSKIQIVVPRKSVLEEFHKLMFPIVTQMQRNFDEMVILSKLRDALLPRLMSGKIRVPVEAG